MSLSVSTIHQRGEWDDFLSAQKPQTFLQSWNWGEFNVSQKNKIFRLKVVDENKKIFAAALVLKIEAKRGSFLFVPHGPVLYTKAITSKSEEVIKALVVYVKNLAKKENCAFIRISPLMEDTVDNNSTFKKLGFQDAPIHMMHPELAWILDITKDEEDILKNMRKTTRYSIRKAKREGVSVYSAKNTHELKNFWDVYEKTVARHHFVPFSKQYIMDEVEIFGKSDEIGVYAAKYKGEVIASAVIVFTPWSAFYHHGASDPKYTQINASHALQWAAIQDAKKRGCRFYNFWGVVPPGAKNHPWAGISLFKRGFGGFEEKYLHAKDLKVSVKYYITYCIETLRRIKRGL